MSELILEIRDLFFKYRKTDDHVLKGLNFSVEKGKIVGLLGPNGAGKSTTMKILTKLLSDYKGEILYKEGILQIMTEVSMKKSGSVLKLRSLSENSRLWKT